MGPRAQGSTNPHRTFGAHAASRSFSERICRTLAAELFGNRFLVLSACRALLLIRECFFWMLFGTPRAFVFQRAQPQGARTKNSSNSRKELTKPPTQARASKKSTLGHCRFLSKKCGALPKKMQNSAEKVRWAAEKVQFCALRLTKKAPNSRCKKHGE